MISLLISLVNLIGMVLTIMVLLYVLLGYFVSPGSTILRILRNVVEPALNQVRKIVKPVGGLDLAPMILILLIYVVEWILTRVLALFI
ncbi:MAG: YggT family protein [Anaerolineaceae bacterium]